MEILKVKGWQKIQKANINQKKAGGYINITKKTLKQTALWMIKRSNNSQLIRSYICSENVGETTASQGKTDMCPGPLRL